MTTTPPQLFFYVPQPEPVDEWAGPLPAGTPVYDREGNLIGTLGESTVSQDPEFDWTVHVIPSGQGAADG